MARTLSPKEPGYYDQVKDNFARAWFRKFEMLLDGASIGPVWLKDEVLNNPLNAGYVKNWKDWKWNYRRA